MRLSYRDIKYWFWLRYRGFIQPKLKEISRSNASHAYPMVFTLCENALTRGLQWTKAENGYFVESKKTLIRHAERYMLEEICSVMDKTILPPSGDIHDYLSLSRYWHPNPDTTDGLPYVQIDGKVNPETKSDAVDHDKMGEMAKKAFLLALAYYYTQNTAYAKRAITILDTWFVNKSMAMNPNLEYASTRRGHDKINTTRCIESVRLMKVVEAVQLLMNYDDFDERTYNGLQDWFTKYLHWLMNHEGSKQTAQSDANISTWYDAQVCLYAVFTGQEKIASNVLKTRSITRFDQFDRNGRQVHEIERSSGFDYSIYNLDAWLCLSSVARFIGLDLYRYRTRDGRCLSKVIDYMALYADENRSWPHNQSSELKRIKLLSILRRASISYFMRSYEDHIKLLPEEKVKPDMVHVTYPPTGVPI